MSEIQNRSEVSQSPSINWRALGVVGMAALFSLTGCEDVQDEVYGISPPVDAFVPDGYGADCATFLIKPSEATKGLGLCTAMVEKVGEGLTGEEYDSHIVVLPFQLPEHPVEVEAGIKEAIIGDFLDFTGLSRDLSDELFLRTFFLPTKELRVACGSEKVDGCVINKRPEEVIALVNEEANSWTNYSDLVLRSVHEWSHLLIQTINQTRPFEVMMFKDDEESCMAAVDYWKSSIFRLPVGIDDRVEAGEIEAMRGLKSNELVAYLSSWAYMMDRYGVSTDELAVGISDLSPYIKMAEVLAKRPDLRTKFYKLIYVENDLDQFVILIGELWRESTGTEVEREAGNEVLKLQGIEVIVAWDNALTAYSGDPVIQERFEVPDEVIGMSTSDACWWLGEN